MLQKGILKRLFILLNHNHPQLQSKALEIIQFFDARYQSEIITQGALRQLLDVLALDPTKSVVSTLVKKTLSVIYHFDVEHQGSIIKEGLLEPIVGLLAINNSDIRLKTLQTIYHFDHQYLPSLVSANFLSYIPLLLQDKDNDVKNKALEAVEVYHDNLPLLVKGGLLKALAVVINTNDAALIEKAFQILEFVSADVGTLRSEGILRSYCALITPRQPEAIIQKVLDTVWQFCLLDNKLIMDFILEGFYDSVVSYLKGMYTPSRQLALDLFKLFVEMSASHLQKNGLVDDLITLWKNIVVDEPLSNLALKLLIEKSDLWKPQDLALFVKHNVVHFVIARMHGSIGPSTYQPDLEVILEWLNEKKLIAPYLDSVTPMLVCSPFLMEWKTPQSLDVDFPDHYTARKIKGGLPAVTLRLKQPAHYASGVYRFSVKVSFGNDSNSNIYVGIAPQTFPETGTLGTCSGTLALDLQKGSININGFRNIDCWPTSPVKSGDIVTVSFYSDTLNVGFGVNGKEWGIVPGSLDTGTNFCGSVTLVGDGVTVTLVDSPLFPNPEYSDCPYDSLFNKWVGVHSSQTWYDAYNTDKHGWGNPTFYNNAQNRGPTFTVVELHNGDIFGGYTKTNWRMDILQTPIPPTDFLFSISTMGSPTEEQFFPNHYNMPRLASYGSRGPMFGSPDLVINLDRPSLSYAESTGFPRLRVLGRNLQIKNVTVWAQKGTELTSMVKLILLLNTHWKNAITSFIESCTRFFARPQKHLR
eukprot:TRINITY_DN1494_c1_g3_i1.p1 TRINITY_DN1494_c1_g3~~TRINITY_DN1494_c1_g3_i1.p1  ORF type:complete len:856 (-),score=77.11 TRINITY_DN1494_c1_g3_i1:575-2839(-)